MDLKTFLKNNLIFYEVRSFMKYRKKAPFSKTPKRKELKYNIKEKIKSVRNWGFTGSFINQRYSYLHKKKSLYFIPNNFYKWKLIPRINPRKYANVLGDKSLLDINFPEASPNLLTKVDGEWFSEHKKIDKGQAHKLILSVLEEGQTIVVKDAHSYRGRSVNFYELRENEKALMHTDSIESLCIQKMIYQCKELSKYHPESLNTVRIITYNYKGQVHYLSSLVRFGVGNSRVDNTHAGGVALVLKKNGIPHEKACDDNFNEYEYHPDTKIRFSELRIPNWEKAVNFALSLHQKAPEVGIIGWDLAIEESEIWLIESNAQCPDINRHQVYNGPLFGESKEKITEISQLRKNA